jgi:hypothetical protein
LKQALEKAELELKSTSDFVPVAVSIVAAGKVVVRTEPLVMVLRSVKGPYSHIEGLADMHPMSRNFVQKEVVGVL